MAEGKFSEHFGAARAFLIFEGDLETQGLTDSHRACFACGVCNNGGFNLHFDIDSDGMASATWQPSPSFQSYPDRLHGGVIATLLDSAMVHALFARGIAGVTAEMTIRYLTSVGLQEPVRVTGSVACRRHGVYLCHAELHQNGNRAVRASAKFMAMTPPVTQESS
jgi:acyl-coenzyme A thioesterase PaaI-like protein